MALQFDFVSIHELPSVIQFTKYASQAVFVTVPKGASVHFLALQTSVVSQMQVLLTSVVPAASQIDLLR